MSPAMTRTRTVRSGGERTNHEATAPPPILCSGGLPPLPRDIKITQCKHKVSHFYLNYFLHVAFTVIFEVFSYIIL